MGPLEAVGVGELEEEKVALVLGYVFSVEPDVAVVAVVAVVVEETEVKVAKAVAHQLLF